ncbi:MAG: hypothetical protein ACI9NC_002112 [Verrucomicrobiales bacterium]|jgi:hypothetical protein
MTDDDIATLEEALNLKVPQEYAEFVCSDRNRREFDMPEMGSPLPFDRASLERDNRLWRETPVACDYWRSSWLSIFPDGTGNTYFITTDPYGHLRKPHAGWSLIKSPLSSLLKRPLSPDSLAFIASPAGILSAPHFHSRCPEVPL